MAEQGFELTSVWHPSPASFYKALLLQIPWQSTCGYLWGRETKGQIQARRTLPKKVVRALLRPKEEASVRKTDKIPTGEKTETRGKERSEPGSQGISFQKWVCTDLHSPGSEDSEQGVPFKQHPALLPNLPNTRLGAVGPPSSDFPLVTLDLLTMPLGNSLSHCPTL